MNAGDLRDAVPEIAERLAELERERERLADLTQAYRVVERSKFSQLQTLAADVKALLGRGRKEAKLFRPAARPAIEPFVETPGNGPVAAANAAIATANGRGAAGLAGTLKRLIDELTLARAGYLDTKDALEAERSQSYAHEPYERFLQLFGVRGTDLDKMREVVSIMPRRPLFSVIMATYDTPERYLRAALDSVRAQVYPDWELCIADDASRDPRVRRILEEYAGFERRIKLTFRSENGHISRASNSALALAQGEFVGFLDHDDLLTPDALFECALAANRMPDVDMLYSDEDKIDDDGEWADPFFKPDWNPDTFLSRMYTCHFGVYRRALVEAIGGLRPEFDGSQDYDLVLRLTERTTRIHHIAKVLYHWRVHPNSTASTADVKPYAEKAAERAITEALARRGEPGRALAQADAPGTYIVRYAIRERKKVSVIIPTRNHGDDVDRCLGSLFAKNTYDDFEIVLLDNGSDEPASLQAFERWVKADKRVRIVRYDAPFNFSNINNYAVTQCEGHYLLFLNNDTEVISPDFMEAMVEQAQRPSIGAVGALLLYPDGTIQHAGVIVGLGGVAGHSHKHFPGQAPGYFYTLRAINNVTAVTAACMMVRRSVFEEVGGFTEKFAVAFNDVDFCMRLRRAGYRNVYLPHAKLYHFESKSRGYETTPEKQARFDREIALMREVWGTHALVDPCYSPNLTDAHEDYSIRTS
jgi:GT2 family glycosyltransferase